jgi:tryptophanase
MAGERLFYRMHSLGLIKPLLKVSKKLRQQILESVHYNTDLITGQLAVLDMLTDSRMHRIQPIQKFISVGSIDVHAIKLEEVLKEFTGFSFVFAVAQGRQAEQLLTGVLSPSGKIVVTNGLFLSTWYHTMNAGAKICELPVSFSSMMDEVFQGNINIVEFNKIVKSEKTGQISHVYIECCNNALGGKPVSLGNFEELSQVCRNNGIPLIIDATRIFQNAELIRKQEPGYEKMKLSEIVHLIFKLADGCTISSTKEMNVETGGMIGLNDVKLVQALGDNVMLYGEGLSVRAKAQLSRAYSCISKIDKSMKRQIESIENAYKKLRKAGVPVVGLPGGVGLYLYTDELKALKIPNPEKSFLASLYYKSGILGSVNYSTPALSKENLNMLRFVITTSMANFRTMRYFTKHLINSWQEIHKLRGLEKTWQPEGKAGEFFASYKYEE